MATKNSSTTEEDAVIVEESAPVVSQAASVAGTPGPVPNGVGGRYIEIGGGIRVPASE